ncbi:MAG: peptidoglycan DD-metalloendopeptidase family protein [Saprospiraceae bacterium]|nr:peptidoglycan DD-metalloendopeptidase family protein [Saprospiraceae bacterium]
MKRKIYLHGMVVFIGVFQFVNAQINTFESKINIIEILENNEPQSCITSEQYNFLENQCNKNAQILDLQTTLIPGSVSLSWPLQADTALKDCSYYRISAYVDQNTTTGNFEDFNCGSNTYDGHKGTDISIWPNNFYKMDNNLVKVIAAASGIIIDKQDGEFDKNCGSTSATANYIVIQHEDGSRAIYFHMKKNSLTAKIIGQSVLSGEFLGIVGSSGNSSGPHLHFEVWSGSTVSTRIDPFSGTCNTLNSKSWWNDQKEYKESAIVKVSSNTTDIVLPPCPGTETLNESSSFQIPFQGTGLPAGFAKFYMYIREEIIGLKAEMRILNPDGSNFTNWTYISVTDSKTRIQGYSKKLPTLAGKYIFKASYNGKSCSTDFEIINPTKSSSTIVNAPINLYPNPSNGNLRIDFANHLTLDLIIYNNLGNMVFKSKLIRQTPELNLVLPSGMYMFKLLHENQIMNTGKLIIE